MSDNNRNSFSIYALHFEHTDRHRRGITDTINRHATTNTLSKKDHSIVIYQRCYLNEFFYTQFSHAKWQNAVYTVYIYMDWKLDSEKKAERNKKRLKQWAKLMWKRDGGKRKLLLKLGPERRKKMRLQFAIVFSSIIDMEELLLYDKIGRKKYYRISWF